MTEKEAIKDLIFFEDKLHNGIFGYKIGCLDAAIKALEEIQQYRAIGTVEECREAVERRRARKPKIELDETKSFHRYYCPVCNRDFCNDSSSFFMASIFKENYCQEKDCGQAIDWSDIP